MLNNTVREFLLQAGRGNTALMIDVLYYAGWQAGENFDFQDAYEYAGFFGASERLVRAGLNDPLFKRQGRRNARYILPSPDEVLSALNLLETPFKDDLTGTAFASLSAYRQALHVALLARTPGRYSRRLLSRRLGVTRITTLHYENKINAGGHDFKIQAQPQFKYIPVTQENIGSLPLKASGAGGHLWLEYHPAPNVNARRAPLVQAVAWDWVRAGHEVFITQQVSNYYQVVPALV